MTGPELAPEFTAPNGAAPVKQANSRLDELRAVFSRELKEPRLYRRLPCSDNPVLVAEYRVLSTDEAQSVLEADTGELGRNADALIRALVAIHVHDPDDTAASDRGLVDLGRWVGEDLGGPVRFDKRLADTLGIEPGTAREICLAMFAGNEIALGAHAAQLLAWMTDTRSEALQDFTAGS